MEQRRLGRTGINVSVICLGTMTFGEQNTEAEGHAQLDYALDHGVTFIDTAEMYPVPPSGKTYGATEAIVGNWISARKNRDKFVLATKVVGASRAGLGAAGTLVSSAWHECRQRGRRWFGMQSRRTSDATTHDIWQADEGPAGDGPDSRALLLANSSEEEMGRAVHAVGAAFHPAVA